MNYIQKLCEQIEKVDGIFKTKNQEAQSLCFNKLKANARQKKLMTRIIKQQHQNNLKQKFQRWKMMHFKVLQQYLAKIEIHQQQLKLKMLVKNLNKQHKFHKQQVLLRWKKVHKTNMEAEAKSMAALQMRDALSKIFQLQIRQSMYRIQKFQLEVKFTQEITKIDEENKMKNNKLIQQILGLQIIEARVRNKLSITFQKLKIHDIIKPDANHIADSATEDFSRCQSQGGIKSDLDLSDRGIYTKQITMQPRQNQRHSIEGRSQS